MPRLEIYLADDELAALERAAEDHRPQHAPTIMARLLIRDELIRMGILPLPRQNRSRWAGGRRKA